jgi:tetratricopeptide (TPR) repeat protein
VPDLGIETHMQNGRWEEAEHACNAALQVQPTSAKLHAYLGMCYFRRSICDKAVDSFKKATLLDPNFVDAGIKLAQSYDRLQRYEEAYATAVEWLRIRPADRTLQGLVHGLQHQVKGNRTDGWERTQRVSHRVVLASDGE